MRKLVYVLTNGSEVETLREAQMSGFGYEAKMVEVKKEETEEERAKREATIAKRLIKMGKAELLAD